MTVVALVSSGDYRIHPVPSQPAEVMRMHGNEYVVEVGGGTCCFFDEG